MSEFIVTFYWALYMSIVAKIKCFDRIWLLQCFYIMESVSFLMLYILKSMDESELVVDTFWRIFAQMNFVSFATVNNFAQNGAHVQSYIKFCKNMQHLQSCLKLCKDLSSWLSKCLITACHPLSWQPACNAYSKFTKPGVKYKIQDQIEWFLITLDNKIQGDYGMVQEWKHGSMLLNSWDTLLESSIYLIDTSNWRRDRAHVERVFSLVQNTSGAATHPA